MILMDQRPIGRTPRANPLTYTKAMDPIRQLLANTPAAGAKGFGPSHFSFNVSGGRCETCRGDGFEKVEMQFLSDVFITCPDCSGKRYKEDVLKVTYKGNNIYDMKEEERREMGIDSLPSDLWEAINLMEGSDLVRDALGEHIFNQFVSHLPAAAVRQEDALLFFAHSSAP